MKNLKRFLALTLVILSVFSCFVSPASATTTSFRIDTRTITVCTKANWWVPGSESITLSQSTGAFSYSETTWYGRETGKTLTKKAYATWRIHVAATDGSHTYSKTWSDGSITLTLKPNKTYKITVSYNGMQDVFRGLDYRNAKWTIYPSWRVKSTWKVSSIW